MSEPTIAGQPLTAEQQAFLTAQTAQQAAEQSAGIAAPAAATAAAMTERGPLLPAEILADQQMEALRARSEALQAQLEAQAEQFGSMQAAVTSMQRQMEEAQAASGGPLTVRYALGAAEKVAAFIASHPNNPLGLHHFDPAKVAAAQLADAAKAVVKGGPVGDVHTAADALERFFGRTHARTGGMAVDASALLDDVDAAREEAAKLAAVA